MAHLAPANDFAPGYVLFTILRGYISWFWVIGITGLAIKYLRSTNQLKEYLNQSTYPVYVLHMLVLTTVAYCILRLNFNLVDEFLVIVVLTLAATLLIYGLLVRRIGILRFLFGLHTAATKPTPRRPGVVAG